MTRTVTKLLQATYDALGEGYIQPTLLGVWENSGSGEAVAAETMVALELAAREVMQTKNMTFARLEATDPDMIKPRFEAAIAITEKPKAATP